MADNDAVATQPDISELYAEAGTTRGSTVEALRAEAAMTMARLMGSLRPDMAGSSVSMMVPPTSYQQKVSRMWESYNTDPLFSRLINRTVDFSANGSIWEVPTEPDDQSWIKKLRNWVERPDSQLDRQETVWNVWWERINMGVPGVLPGGNEVVRWIAKHLLLGGMATLHWQLGTIKVGKKAYTVPTVITVYPGSSITLRRQRGYFVNEEIFYWEPFSGDQKSVIEGQPQESPQFLPFSRSATIHLDRLPPMAIDQPAAIGSTEAFALKYNWSPGDLSTTRMGTITVTGMGIYPSPPFLNLLEQFIVRRKLFAADIALLDGVINYMMLWKIGNKDHEPKAQTIAADGTITPGTISYVRQLIQQGRLGQAVEFFVPWYVDLDIKMPDPAVLLSPNKYSQSALEIFQAFGIFYARTGRDRMERINITNFEEMLNSLRMQIGSFFHLMAQRIRTLNPDLKAQPQWSPFPINTKTEVFLQALMKLAAIGKVSMRTLLRYHNLDDSVEIRRIAQELALDVDDLANENVPLSYVQQAVQPDTAGDSGTEESQQKSQEKSNTARTRRQTGISPDKQAGRPPGMTVPALDSESDSQGG